MLLSDKSKFFFEPIVDRDELLKEELIVNEDMDDLNILLNLVRKVLEYIIINKDGNKLNYVESKKYLEELIYRINKQVLEYEYLINNFQIGLCAIDIKGNVTEWNSSIERVYGISRNDIIGKPLADFFEDPINLRVLKTGESIRNTFHEPKRGCQIIINSEPIYYNSELIGVISTDYSIRQVQVLSDQLKIAKKTIKNLERQLDNLEENKFDFFIGKSKKIKEQVNLASMVSNTDVPILIYGESGTGKEVFARFIHKESGVKGKFVAVNCSAIPNTLFESEFFGYEKGAFTGASKSGKKGYFKQANYGTLFLDEIGELPLEQQSKLLRVIQEEKVTPVGAERDEEIDVRIICATNLDLEEKIIQKEFRVDLFYRLKGIKIELPPIRERQEDIQSMIQYFFIEIVEKYNKKVKKVSPKAMNILRKYSWPGNIREMKNVIRQMVLMTKGEELLEAVIPKEIYFSVLGGNDEIALDSKNMEELGLSENIKMYEKHLIKKALWKSKGNIAEASSILKIPRSTLHYRIDKYKIEV